MTTRLLFALILSVACAACDDAPTEPTPTTPTSPTTSTLSSRLTRGGTITRAFATTKDGPIVVTLLNTGSPTNVIGVGLGAPLGGVAACTLTTSVVTAGSPVPQISADTVTGNYCVMIYDPGTMTGPIDFDLSITFP